MMTTIVFHLGVTVTDETEEDVEDQVTELTKTIIEQMPNHCPEEIEEAFKMAAMGKLEGVEIYQKLDGVIFSRVMRAYNKLRDPLVAQYRKTLLNAPKKEVEMSKEETHEKNNQAYTKHFNNFIVPAYEEFLKQKTPQYVPDYDKFEEWYSSDCLIHFGMMNLDPELKNEFWPKAKNIAEKRENDRVLLKKQKGEISKFDPSNIKPESIKIYKCIRFWEQMLEWKIEGKVIKPIENK